MSIKDYARNHKKRKEDTQQSGLLMVGVDGSEVRHYDCMGARAGVICRKLGFTHACGGFNRNILEKSGLKKFLNHYVALEATFYKIDQMNMFT